MKMNREQACDEIHKRFKYYVYPNLLNDTGERNHWLYENFGRNFIKYDGKPTDDFISAYYSIFNENASWQSVDISCLKDITEWCDENCNGMYLIGPNWDKKIQAKFQLKADAMKFKLMWG